MNEYEVLNENLKILWKPEFTLNGEKYTQVSGYVFNENNELLIVRNENTWTVPGGHPEKGETPLDTLNREIMEEACVTVKDPVYIGAVEVVENGETYYQLRYKAMVDKELEFKQEWEISERKFVKLEDLDKFIKWANGPVFSAQIKSATK